MVAFAAKRAAGLMLSSVNFGFCSSWIPVCANQSQATSNIVVQFVLPPDKVEKAIRYTAVMASVSV